MEEGNIQQKCSRSQHGRDGTEKAFQIQGAKNPGSGEGKQFNDPDSPSASAAQGQAECIDVKNSRWFMVVDITVGQLTRSNAIAGILEYGTVNIGDFQIGRRGISKGKMQPGE